jgi:hypothetical protein
VCDLTVAINVTAGRSDTGGTVSYKFRAVAAQNNACHGTSDIFFPVSLGEEFRC